MPKVTVNQEKCKGCLLCVHVCPKGSLVKEKQLNKRGAHPVKFIDKGDCLGCAMCAIICPDCCITVYK